MNFQHRWLTAAAVTAVAVSAPCALALVSLEDGKDHLYVDASVEMAYDSSVFANSQSQGSLVYEGSLGIEFTRRAGWIGVNGSASLDFARYANFREQNYMDPKLSAEFTKQTGRTTGSLTMSVQREDRADVDVNTRDVSWNYDVGLNFQYPVITRYTFSGSLDYSRADYQDKQLFTNLSTYSGSLYLYYILNEQRDLFIDYRARYSDEAVGVSDVDNSLSGGVSGKVFGPFNGSVQVGYESRATYGGLDRGTYGDLTASGSTTWNISRRMTLTGNLSRDFSTIATGQSVNATSAGLTFQDSFTAKSSMTLSGTVGETQFLGISGLSGANGRRRVDTFYNLSAAYFYTINQHLKISVSYSYYASYSDLAIAEFPRHQMNLTLSSHW
jgi:Putative beta-barrel porin 2